jgi:hypothetical protein
MVLADLSQPTVCVIGVGYVGSRGSGLLQDAEGDRDTDRQRINYLGLQTDGTRLPNLTFTADPKEIGQEVYRHL